MCNDLVAPGDFDYSLFLLLFLSSWLTLKFDLTLSILL